MAEGAAPVISVSKTTLLEARRSLRDISAHSRNNKRVNKDNEVPPSSPVKVSKDVLALQQLVAALSFSPKSVVDFPSSTEFVDENKPTKQFSFESPKKKTMSTNDTAGDGKDSIATPWVRPQQSTPPTAKLEMDEEEGVEFFGGDEEREEEYTETEAPEEPSPDTTCVEQEAASSPVRSLRSITNSADAVAMAYPLCLPAEFMRKNGASRASTNSNTFVQSKKKPSSKPCKRFPPVATDIPGVGVQRSSAVLATKGKNKFSPFARIANENDEATDSNGRPLFSCRNQASKDSKNVAIQAYGHAKGAWIWGKDNAALISPILGMAEGVLSKVADITTGNGDLEHVDQQMVEPLVSALDEHILNPVLGTVGGILSGILGKNRKD